jgi:hypothetical protein
VRLTDFETGVAYMEFTEAVAVSAGEERCHCRSEMGTKDLGRHLTPSPRFGERSK